ncbi:PQQ-dependent sugar dehydrogenase [Microbulbifer halophilus]|uniref:PQQ-dependent sugar dehydrogenase n=1 Tax=Microbulbifer halophilus TaxID=453963 RepID=A0ABW5E6Y5_9GAMM|nr:PQQ-dependent sugar dehydrogenase [Microbulbifer halophilus]MCW8125867.1 PQQ-dependent sugar dehydrogenase [Microbulbifer halophilus]
MKSTPVSQRIFRDHFSVLRSLSIAALAATVLPVHADSAADLYKNHCSGCHGNAPPALATEAAEKIIRDGRPGRGMPAFGANLDSGEIRSLARYLGGSAQHDPVSAMDLNPEHSYGYRVLTSEADPQLRYLGFFNTGDSLCYDDIDLGGVASLELDYANGGTDPGRFSLVAIDNSGAIVHLGEKETPVTGGWEKFGELDIGLARRLEGPHQLCFAGIYGSGVFNLRSFTPSARPAQHGAITRQIAFNADGLLAPRYASKTIRAGGHRFKAERIAGAPGELWAMDFLPGGELIATQLDGQLWLFKNGERRGPVRGIPEVHYSGQGGLLEVTAHPDYAENGWLYLTFADSGENGNMTRVVRGRLRGLQWTEQQDIYRAPARFHSDTTHHYGSRLQVRDGYVFFSIGDRGNRDSAQDTDDPRGKIHRLRDDGRIPADNPFENSVWSYGHRNPQGLALQPAGGALWSAEHGPRGGDEINRLHGGRNYGWPLATHGINYDGSIITEHAEREGMESPLHHWTPSIGVSALDFYRGDRFPAWRDQLLVASLATQELRLLQIEDGRVTGDEILLDNANRIRDVRSGPDGYPYLVMGDGIYRLEPVEG